MASEGAGKARSKRYNEHGKPYERRRSIIGIVTDTVKGIFKSTWSEKEEKNPKEVVAAHDGNGRQGLNSVQHKSDLNHTHGIGNNLGQSYLQPQISAGAPGPSKIMPSHMPMPMSQILPQPLNRPEPSSFTSEHLPFVQYEGKPASLIVNGGDDRSELSECSISTSGCSSMAPHPDKKDYQHDMMRHHESRIHHMRQELGGSMTPSKEIEARGSLGFISKDTRSKVPEKSFMWTSQGASGIRRPQSPASGRSPSFNVSIFGSSYSQPHKAANTGTGHNDSLFYSGKTTFGGASSQKKRKLQETSPPQWTPNKRQVKAKPLNSNISGISSSSARRILSTLDRMSSPLSDAKKIPSYNSSLADSPLSFTPSSFSSVARRRNSAFRSSLGTSVLKGPPVHAMSTPGTVQIAKNYNQPSYLKEPQSTCPSSCSVTAPQTVQSEPGPSTSKMGKMKRDRSQHYSKKDDDDVVEVPDLPTGFTLPVTSIPKFDFAPSAITSTPLPADAKLKRPAHRLSSDPFTFSTPIPKSQPDNQFKSATVQNFQFSSPIAIDNAISTAGQVSSSVPQGVATSQIAFPETKSKAAPSLPKPDLDFKFDVATAKRKPISTSPAAVVVPKTPEPEGGFQPAKEMKIGSVMDILGGSKKKSPENVTTPVTSAKAPTPTAEAPSLNQLFKKPTGSWECPTCMIQNKSDATTCPACTTPKPGGSSDEFKPAESSVAKSTMFPPTPVSNSLAEQFKKPEGTWECDTCMVMNSSTATKCIACETSKPGFKKATSFTSAGGFKIGPTGGFQFGSLPAMDSKSEEISSNASGGFKMALATVPETDNTDTKPLGGGFKFGASLATNAEQTLSSTNAEQTLSSSVGVNNLGKIEVPASGGFKFGTSLEVQSLSSATGIVSGDIKIGQPSGSDNDGKPQDKNSDSMPIGGFKFGESLGNKQETAPPKTTESGFTFGQTVAPESKTVASKVTDKASPFSFGDSIKSAEPMKSTSNVQQSSGFFTSGAPVSSNMLPTSQTSLKQTVGSTTTSAAVTNNSSFSFSTTQPSDSKPNFSSVTCDKKDNAQPATSGVFAFGQQSKESSSTGFAFGAPTNTTSNGAVAPKPATAGFSFNKPTDTTSTASTGAPAAATGPFSFEASTKLATSKPAEPTPAVPPTFAFGAQTNSAAPAVQPAFSFGNPAKPEATGAAPLPAFNFSATSKPTTTSTGIFAKPAEATAPSTATNNLFSFTGKPGQLNNDRMLGSNPTSNLFAFGAKPHANFGAGSASILGKRTGPGDPLPPVFGEHKKNKARDERMSTSGNPSENLGIPFGQNTLPNSGTVFPDNQAGNSGQTATFAFGQNNPTPIASTAPSFGTQAAPSTNTFGSFTKSASSPAFGTMAKTTTAANMFAPSNNTATPAFGTGSSAPAFGTVTSTTPAFGSSTPNAPAFGAPSAPAPAFGTPQTSGTAGFGTTPANNGFQFGAQQPQQTSTSSVFQFGQASQAPANAGFNFGQSVQPSVSNTQPPAYNFGTAATSPPSFQFNAQPTAPTPNNPFNVSAALSSSTPARRVKKATRKLTRK